MYAGVAAAIWTIFGLYVLVFKVATDEFFFVCIICATLWSIAGWIVKELKK